MNILFVCGSLEPGKDGVGDYTRQIAGQLKKKNHTIYLLALNDPFTPTSLQEMQIANGEIIPTMRLSSVTDMKHKFVEARNWVSTFNPDWVSLQYVLYAFHPKGLPYKWINLFKQISPQSRWHVNMHELWIGNKKEESVKAKLLGILQRYIIKSMLQSIQPVWMNTSVDFYKQLLQTINFSAIVQPVFSNIPAGDTSNTHLYNQLPVDIRNQRGQLLFAVLFGAINSYPDMQDNLLKIRDKAVQENKQLVLIHLGRSHNIEALLEAVQMDLGCICLAMGEQSGKDIAAFFQHSDIGISTYGEPFLGKSGSVAAMLNNNLPVVLIRRFQVTSTATYPYAKHIDDINSLNDFINQPKTFSELYGLKDTLKLYLTHFGRTSSKPI